MAQTNQTDYTYVASGSPDFLVPFPYLSTSGVEVTVDGAPTGVIWTALNSIQLTPTPAVGAAVRIRRNTDARGVRNDFSAGAPFSPRNINENNEQLLYAVEEAVNDTSGTAAAALVQAGQAVVTAGAAAGRIDAAVALIDDALQDSALYLRNDLANTTDPAKGAGMVGYRGRSVAALLDHAFAGEAFASDYGVIGSAPGELVDDTEAFLAACADCKARGLRLNIGTLKIYLPSLDAPIDLDGWMIVGSGTDLYAPMDDWSVPRGINDASASLIPNALEQQCAVIIHTGYNGALFTGKFFNARNIGVLGAFNLANNKAFEQTTPTAYPGWSQALRNTDRVVIAYTGSHGVHIKGGLEVLKLGRIVTKFCGGNGLYVTTTAGIECPVEYLEIDSGSYTSSRGANIRLDGVRKHVTIGRGVVLNDPGMIRLIPGGAVSGTVAPTTEDALVPAIQLALNGVSAPCNISVSGTIAEYCNLMLKTTGNYTNALSVEDTTQYPVYESGWVWRTGLLTHTATRGGVLARNSGNITPYSAVFAFRNHASTDVSVSIDEQTTVTGLAARALRLLLAYDERTSTIGNGDAGTFTAAIVKQMDKPPADNAGLSQVFSVVANFQGTGGNGAGAYLVLVTRGAGANYVGITFAGSSTTGFTSPPTINASTGEMSVSLAQYYRARVTRLDRGSLF